MPTRLIRPFLIVEFLIAIEVWLTFWTQVGGQYHLDLMFWPWKFGLTVAAAWLITAITAELLHEVPDGIPNKPSPLTRRALLYAGLLFAVVVAAGIVTYYYHMNEPADDENSDETPTTQTYLKPAYQTRQALAATIGLPTVQPKAF